MRVIANDLATVTKIGYASERFTDDEVDISSVLTTLCVPLASFMMIAGNLFTKDLRNSYEA